MDDVVLHSNFRSETPGRIALASNQIHVWAIALGGSNDRFTTLLSPAEQTRAARFQVADHRRRFAISHGALRAILAGYTGQDALALEFGSGTRGKPSLLSASGWHFNLTHSAQLAMVAVARIELGIDVEKRRHLESLRQIANRHFSKVEFELLEALPQGEQLTGFYRCWTRKEAYVKAIGSGLASSLDVFDVSISAEPHFLGFRTGDDVPEDWDLIDISPAPDYTAALAVRARNMTVHTLALLDG